MLITISHGVSEFFGISFKNYSKFLISFYRVSARRPGLLDGRLIERMKMHTARSTESGLFAGSSRRLEIPTVTWSSRSEQKVCASRRMLKRETLAVNFSLDTAEIEPPFAERVGKKASHVGSSLCAANGHG